MGENNDRTFFRNFAIILGGLVAFTILFVFVARMVANSPDAFVERKTKRIAERTEPVYTVVTDPKAAQQVAKAQSGANDGQASGKVKPPKKVYKSVCSTCHATGVLGAPKFGNADAWKSHIAKGKSTLYRHSIEGFNAMPPKGGATYLSDAEVKATVDYMIKQSGGWQ